MPDRELKSDYLGHRVSLLLEEHVKPRDWQPRNRGHKTSFRIFRLCILGIFLPAALVAGPIYLRYRVYSEQVFPLSASDQRLIDGRVSTTWCQRQVVKVNATFNAYLMSNEPNIKVESTPVSMMRHLILEDDMKEYWGFYLLRGSSVTVSTCVRWPGASLTVIRGHKHLHECAFIGDDSSEELEELLEVAEERGILKVNGTIQDSPSNEPDKMKRVHGDVEFHHKDPDSTSSSPLKRQYNSHELDAKAMRTLLQQLLIKRLDIQKKKRVYNSEEVVVAAPKINSKVDHHHYEGVYKETANIDKPPIVANFSVGDVSSEEVVVASEKAHENLTKGTTTTVRPKTQQNYTSEEIVSDVVQKINSLGKRGKQLLRKLVHELDQEDHESPTINLTKIIDEEFAKNARARRDLLLSGLHAELNDDNNQPEDQVEESMLRPDGIAEDRGTVNETTLNDRSNSEFWSSFSSSEERLLECNGLILNLPLTPHRHCAPKNEHHHAAASMANTITYRVPSNGYYFFVFNSENEIQPNYLRVQFNLLKTSYNTSNPVYSCKNKTSECAIPFNFFSNERTILEMPLNGNDSQWNEEYVVVSTCEPRTSIYLTCIIVVPLLILLFAFH